MDLVVQTSYHSLFGSAMIVLYKSFRETILGKAILVIKLHKEAAVIGENLRLDNQDTRDRCFGEFEFAHIKTIILSSFGYIFNND